MAADPRFGVVPAGSVIRLADGRTVRLARTLPAPPAGMRRCWFCCHGRLIGDQDEAESEHRFVTAPLLADPVRCHAERLERADSEQRAAATAWNLGPSLTVDVWRMGF